MLGPGHRERMKFFVNNVVVQKTERWTNYLDRSEK